MKNGCTTILVILSCVAFVLFVSTPVNATSHVVINEMEINPEGTDAGNEWLELYNPTNCSINLTGWTLMNEDGDVYFLLEMIPANGYVVIEFPMQWLDNNLTIVTLYNGTTEVDKTPSFSDEDNSERVWARYPNGIDTDSGSDWRPQLGTKGYSNGEPAPNNPPIADFSYTPSSPKVNETIQFTDSSSDSDGLIVSWNWDLGDGSTSTLENPTHEYTSAGNYTVILTVEDNNGTTNSTAQIISVAETSVNTPPIASFTITPSEGNTSTTFTFDASGCSDNEDSLSMLQVRWDWENDGIWDTTYITDKTITHRFTTEGNKTISLEVIDSGGLSDITLRTLVVTKVDDTTPPQNGDGDTTPPTQETEGVPAWCYMCSAGVIVFFVMFIVAPRKTKMLISKFIPIKKRK